MSFSTSLGKIHGTIPAARNPSASQRYVGCERRALGKGDQEPQQPQHDHDGGQPPFLADLEEKPELANQLRHDLLSATVRTAAPWSPWNPPAARAPSSNSADPQGGGRGGRAP